MLTLLALVGAAEASDIYNVNLWRESPSTCTSIVVNFERVPMIVEGFYVDFFVGRYTPPAFGEWGDYWFYVDRVNNTVSYMDGTAIPRWTNPRDVQPGDEMWFLRDVGQVYHDIRTADTRWTVKLYEPLADGWWWDVIVNSDANVDETNYNNNWDEVQVGCNN